MYVKIINSVTKYSRFVFIQAASRSVAVTSDNFNHLHPSATYNEVGKDSRPRTAEPYANDNLFFNMRPKSSGGRLEENSSAKETTTSHLTLPSSRFDDELPPPGVVFQESRANSAMSFIDDPGLKTFDINNF